MPAEDVERASLEALLKARFEEILVGLAGEPEFSPYREHSQGAMERTRKLKSSAVAGSASWLTRQRSAREPLTARLRRLTRSHQVNRRMAVTCGALFAVFTVAAIAMFVATGASDDPLVSRFAGGGLLFAAAFATALATTRGARQDISAANAAISAFDRHASSYVDSVLREHILGEFSIALQDELQARGVLRFPTHAPRLIELTDSTVVGSRSIDRVKSFVTNHETSAIGIAGPRGVGKTTLLRAVAEDVRSRGGVAAIVSAPVEYSATDLLRSLALEIHEQLDERGLRPTQRRGKALPWVGVMLALSGAVVVASAAFPSVAVDIWESAVPLAPFIVGIGLIFVGTFVFLLPRWMDEERSKSPSQLNSLVRDLEYETTNSGAVSAKGFSLGEVTMNRSVARRSLTHGDIAVNLRRALQSITHDGARTVLVAVDELDKLPTQEAAIRTINVLKDIMRVPGLHVLVTVSDEALASFALGTFERDAFDSTFDAMFEVERLSFSDATRLIGSRVVGFPDRLLALCLVSSAGLARDLIREARAIIDTAASAKVALPWAELAKSLVFAQAQETIAAYARTGADLTQVPVWTRAIESVREAVAGPELDLPAGLGDELASRFSRAVISLTVIDWLQDQQSGSLDRLAPILDQLRDTVLMASRRGGAAFALQNLRALGLGTGPSEATATVR